MLGRRACIAAAIASVLPWTPVRTAVGADYDQRLLDFIVQRHSALSRRACSLCRNAARLPNQVALG
jgi:hypothetical protein